MISSNLLSSASNSPSNFVDVADATGFARDDFLVLDDGTAAEEYLRVQFGFSKVFLIRETQVNPRLSLTQALDRLKNTGHELDPHTGGAVAYLWGWFKTGRTLGIAIYGDDARARYDEVSSILRAS